MITQKVRVNKGREGNSSTWWKEASEGNNKATSIEKKNRRI